MRRLEVMAGEKNRYKVLKKFIPYILISPAMLGIALFTIYPIIRVFYLSFTKYDLFTKTAKWIGSGNYKMLFESTAFKKALTNTVVYSAVMIVAVLFLSLCLAVWLGKKNSKLDRVAQATVFLPHIVSMVTVSMIFLQMMEPAYGILNSLLAKLNLPTSQWLQGINSAMPSVLIISVWKHIGYYVLIFIAAFQGIPQSITEAAALDNAGSAKTFFKIQIPMISPQIFFVAIVLTIGSFKVFDTIRLTTDGGPDNATMPLVYQIYREAFTRMNIGSGSAAAVVLVVIVGIMTVLYFKSLEKKVHYQ